MMAMNRNLLAALLLATTATLIANSRLDENLLGAGIQQSAANVAAALQQSSSGYSDTIAAECFVAASGTVWDSIRATQPVYEGTVIPKSFELSTANGSVWVHGNATEHLAEFATANLARGVSPELVNFGTQAQLTSLQAAVEQATANGVQYGRLLNVGGWELKFAAPQQADQLPVLIHALQK
jgi:hypothetical protein